MTDFLSHINWFNYDYNESKYDWKYILIKLLTEYLGTEHLNVSLKNSCYQLFMIHNK